MRAWTGGLRKLAWARRGGTGQARPGSARPESELAVCGWWPQIHAQMNLTTLTSGDLKKIVRLLEWKESHLAKIAAIDKELAAFDEPAAAAPPKAAVRRGRPPGRTAGRPPGRPPARPPGHPTAPPAAPKAAAPANRPGKPGQLKPGIPELLQQAGKGGMKIQEIARRRGSSPGSVRVWFYSHKKIKEIKKVGPGHYAWVSAAVTAKPVLKAPATATGKVQSGRPKNYGRYKASIPELLKTAGKQGLAVKDIASKLGLKTGPVYRWFYGCNIRQIKKVGLARYAWVG
jgi:hypothetical protein